MVPSLFWEDLKPKWPHNVTLSDDPTISEFGHLITDKLYLSDNKGIGQFDVINMRKNKLVYQDSPLGFAQKMRNYITLDKI